MDNQQNQQLDDRSKVEIMQLVNEFTNRPKEEWTAENIEAFSKENDIKRVVTPGFLQDYAYQAQIDAAIEKIYPDILTVLKENTSWTPMFALTPEYEKEKEGRAKAVELIVKLLERENIPYNYAENTLQVVQQYVQAILQASENVTKQRITNVFENLSKKEFGVDIMTMGNVKEYSEEHLKPEEDSTE